MRIECMLFAVTLAVASGAAWTQGWSPQKNVEIVVPVVPGGTNDKLARAIERTLVTGKVVDTSVTVVHKPGGGNQIAYAYLGQHAGDPHYLMIGTTTLISGRAAGLSKLSYVDFSLIASVFNDYLAHAVNPGSSLKTGNDLVARMRADPQAVPLGFASALGNQHHIAAGLLMKGIGASPRDLKTVVFKGSAEALTALLGNHIGLVSTGAGNAAPHVAAGKLRVIGVSSGQRLPGALAGVPTWKEQGVDLVYGSWRAIVGPKGLSSEQMAFWEKALRRVIETPEWRAELERNYWSDYFVTGEALKKTFDREYADTKSILMELGLAKQ